MDKNQKENESRKNTKSCASCIWSDKCQTKVTGKYCANHYDCEDDCGDIEIEEYYVCLKERQEAYLLIIDEMENN